MDEIRYPAVAGVFYEKSKEKLTDKVKSLFKDVATGKNIAVITPHAGYVYSGKSMATAINSLKGAKTFIIIGPNHTGLGAQFSVMTNGIWKMPMGDVKINNVIATELEKSGVADADEMAHLNEHSIEVIIPFLQFKFKFFQIVPISVMNIDYSVNFIERCEKLGREIAKIAKKESVNIIVSSDFSHYMPLEDAKVKDDKAVENITSLDVKNFFAVIEAMDASICGYGPIVILMTAANELGLKNVNILHESSSGDLLKNYHTVVTYKAIGFR